MTRLAVAGVDYFEADDREVHRDGWTFTADTLQTFSDDIEISLILGADAAVNLPTWNRAAEVLERVNLAVAPRPGTPRQKVEEVLDREVTWLEMAKLDVSGTLIRQRSTAGQSSRFLVRDSVWRYFTSHDLYGVSSSEPVE